MSSRDSSSSAATEASTKKSKEPRGRSKTKKRTPSKYELLDRSKTKKSSRSNSLADMSTSAKKKSKEFLMNLQMKNGKFLMQLLVVALFLVLPLTLLLCLATDSVQSDNTWLGFVLHLYISASCVLLTLAAFLFKGLLLLPLYLAVLTIKFLLWLFNCNETVVDQIVTSAAAGPDLRV